MANPKKVLIVSHYYPPHTGGIEYVAQNQAKALAALGDTVTVVTSKVSKDEVNFADGSATVIRVKAANHLEKMNVPFPLFSPRLLIVLSRAAKEADIVHIHDAFYISSWCAALIARLYRRPVVLTQHVDLVPHPSRLIRNMQRLVYATAGNLVFRSSNTIIVLNERTKSFLVARGVSARKIKFISNGVDNELFHPAYGPEKLVLRQKYGLDQHQKLVLFVGRFVPKKGFDKVLSARSEQYQLVFAGGQPGSAALPNVRFLGRLSQPQLAEVYRAADIFVLPASGEGFPLSVQEAMATGLPVIMAYDEAYSLYALDREFVYLLDSTPSTSLVRQAIESLVNNDRLCRQMGNKALQYVRQRFSWPQVARELDQIYSGLLPEISP